MVYCSVINCKNKSSKNSRIRFFRFPKKGRNINKWLEVSSPSTNLDNGRVCSEHFQSSDYKENIYRQFLLDYSPKRTRRLKDDAVPSINVTLQSESPSTTKMSITSVSCVQLAENSSEILRENSLNTNQDSLFINHPKAPINTAMSSKHSRLDCYLETDKSIENLQNLKEDYHILSNKFKELEKERKREKLEIMRDNSRLKKEIKRLQNKSAKDQVYVYEERVKQDLKYLFTSQQVDKLLHPNKQKVIWDTETVASCISLRSISPKCYRYMYKKKFPLVSMPTLRKYTANVDLSEGMLNDVLRSMQRNGLSMKKYEKVVVLSFDEIYISQQIEIDRKLEQVKSYNIGSESTQSRSFMHPSNENFNVFLFADTPHLIKLCRNHFLDTGYIFREITIDGEITTKRINKDILDELMRLHENCELRVAFNLKQEQLDVQGAKRQKVSLATKVLSNTTAQAIKWAGENSLLHNKDGEAASQLIKLFNDWFDIFNAKSHFEAYGKYLEDQNFILNKVITKVRQMKFETPKGNLKKSLFPFQTGMILNCIALQEFLPYLQNKFDSNEFTIKYILTNRLNQDCLENLFSNLRAEGATNDHPSALNFKYRLKWFLLGRDTNIVQSDGTNTTVDNVLLIITLDKQVQNVNDASSIGTDHNITTLQNDEMNYDTGISLRNISENPKNLIEEQGLRYITSRVAAKFRNKYPNLGRFTKDIPKNEISKKDWIQAASCGHLTVACDNFMDASKILETEFVKFHPPSGLSKDKFIFTTLTKIVNEILLKKGNKIPLEVLGCLVRTRTYIRLKNMQEKQKNEKSKENSYKKKNQGKLEQNEDIKQLRKEVKKKLKHVVKLKFI